MYGLPQSLVPASAPLPRPIAMRNRLLDRCHFSHDVPS
jgi:hypothetical protein